MERKTAMTKQIQDAYIVAAVRTPVGKAPRGMFRTVRPDDMLAHVLRGAIAQVPGLDPHDIGDVAVFAKDENVAIAYGMGITAEKVAQQWKVSREDQDAFAAESHRKAAAAIAAGSFKGEILPYEIETGTPDLASGQVVRRKRMAE